MERKKIWVCLACGKRSNDKFGDNPIDKGYDAACVINSQEYYEDECILDENGRVKEISWKIERQKIKGD